MLNLQHIRDRLGSSFEPFTIRLSDGRNIDVPHPDFIAVGRGIVVVVDAKTDSSYRIDPLHIVSIDSPNGG